MFNLAPMYPRIWWKEFRQLLPLMIALPTLSLLLMAIYLMVVPNGQFDPGVMLTFFLVAPMLYSAAAGAVLVSQEFDGRTLTWLSALPISARQLLGNKTLVGLVGLTILWCLSLACIALWNWKYPNYMNTASITLLWLLITYGLYSIYILTCAFTAAWIFRSMLASLIAIVPLAILPLLLAALFVNLPWMIDGSNNNHYSPDPPLTVSFGSLLISQVLVAGIGYWVAMRRLHATAARPSLAVLGFAGESLQAVSGNWFESLRGDSQSRTLPSSPFASLSWQFQHQHLGMLVSLIVVLVASAIGMSQDPNRAEARNSLLPILPIVVVPAICLLGLIVFQGDNVQQRIRFLAERGVAPGQIWWSRQCLPLAILLVYYVFLGFVINSTLLYNLGFVTVLWTIGIVYAMSQWSGQVFKSFPLAIVVGPFISMTTALTALTMYSDRECPIWLLALLFFVVPMIATRWQTRRWMDCRVGWPFWSRHLACLGSSFLLAMMTFTSWWMPYAGSYRTAYPELWKVAQSTYRNEPVPFDFYDHWYNQGEAAVDGLDSDVADATIKPVSLTAGQEWRDQRYQAISAFLAENSTPLYADGLDLFVDVLTMQRLRCEQLVAAEADEAEIKASNGEYQRWMTLLVQYVKRVRSTLRLADQDSADLIEIWLYAEATKPEARARLDRATMIAIADLIGQPDQRWDSRRLAVMNSWRQGYHQLGRYAEHSQFGGYVLQIVDPNRNERRRILRQQQVVDQLAVALIKYIADGKQRRGKLPVEVLTNAFGSPAAEYGQGPSGDLLRIQDANQFFWPVNRNCVLAQQWGGDWEEQARQWRESVLSKLKVENEHD